MKSSLFRAAVSLFLVSSVPSLVAGDRTGDTKSEIGDRKKLEELMAIAEDVRKHPVERARAVHEVAMDGSPHAMDLLMENISLSVLQDVLGGGRGYADTSPCFYELQMKGERAIPAIFRFLQKGRKKDELKLVGMLLYDIEIVSGEMERDERAVARDNIISNLRTILSYDKDSIYAR